MKYILSGLTALLLVLNSCSAMFCKKSPFPNTKWVAEEKMFVADAGTMTITTTLEFTSNKTFRKQTESVMPPHPAMYMNADGTVDTLPGHHNEFVEEGTYTFKGDKLTLNSNDGSKTVLLYKDGVLTEKDPLGQDIVYTKQ